MNEKKPEPTEFTKKIRKILDDHNRYEYTHPVPEYRLWYDACDIIDRMTAENKELKESCKYHVAIKRQRLDCIKKLEVDLKAKDAEIARMKKDKKRLCDALREQGFDTSPIQDGPDIRD